MSEDQIETPPGPSTSGKSGPGRRRRRKRVVLIPAGWLALLALGVLVAPFFLVRIDSVRDWILDRSVEGAVLAGGQRIRVGDVPYFDASGFRFEDVRIEVPADSTDGVPNFVTWFEVRSIEASWNPIGLLSGRVAIHELAIEAPKLDWLKIPDPVFLTRDDPTAPRSGVVDLDLPPIRAERLRVDSVEVVQDGAPWLAGFLRLSGLDHQKGDLQVRLDQGQIRSIPDSLSLTISQGQVHGTLIQYFQIDSLRVAGTGLDAMLGATLIMAPSGSTSVSLDGMLRIDEARPTDVPLLARQNLPWERTDALRGRIFFGGELAPRKDPRADLSVGISGRIFGTALDTLNILADATRKEAELIDFAARSGSFALDGNGWWWPDRHAARGAISFRGLDLSAAPVSAFLEDLPDSDLYGEIQGEADSLGRGIELHASLRLDQGELYGRPVTGFHADLRLDPEEVIIDTIWAGTPDQPTLSASGYLIRDESKRLEATGQLDRFSLGRWVDPWIRVDLDGAVSGPFEIFGNLDHVELMTDLFVEEGQVVEITADSLHAGPATGTIYPFAIDVPVRAWNVDFYGFGVDSLLGDGFLADTISAVAHAWRDTTDIHVRGRVTPTEPGTVFIDEILVLPGAAPHVALAFPTTLEYSKRHVWMDSLEVISDAGRVSGSAWISPQPGQSGTEPFEFELIGEGIDLGALADYYGIGSDSLNGIADVEFRGHGIVDAPGYDVLFRAETTEIWGWLWKEIDIGFRAGALGSNGEQPPALRLFQPTGVGPLPGSMPERLAEPGNLGMVHVDSIRAEAFGYVGQIPILGPERFGPEPPGPPLEVDATRLQTRFARGWKETIDSILMGASPGDSLFAALEDAEISGGVQIRNLPAGPILAPILVPQAKQASRATFAAEAIDPMLAVIRIERPSDDQEFRSSGLGGRVSIDADVTGRGGAPEIRVQGRAEEVQVYQATADSVLMEAIYVDSLLYVRRLDWTEGGRGVRVSGRVPLAVHVNPAKCAILSQPLWLEAEVPSVDLSLASLATTLVADPRGDLQGRVRLKGTPPNIYLEGDLSVREGAFRIPLREEFVERVEAVLHLDSLGVHIEEATGKWNGVGDVRARGWFRDPNRFLLEGEAQDVTVFESGNYNFLADAQLHAAPVASADSLRPRLSGTVQVKQGTITMDLAKPGRQKVLVTPWLIDLDVEAPTNVRVIQPTSSVEVAGAKLQVNYDMPYWNLGGRVDITSGEYQVFNKNLQVSEGRIDFLDQGTGPYPVFDIKARTDIADPEGDEVLEIEIDVNGCPLPGEILEISVSSPTHPEYSQGDLIDLLTIGQLRGGDLTSSSANNPARGFVTGQVLNTIERELIAGVPWLDMVQVTGGTDPSDPIRISLRAITEPQFSVKYSQEIASTSGQEVAFQYRISNLFYLNAAADRRKTEVGTATETYSLDFKWRVDY